MEHIKDSNHIKSGVIQQCINLLLFLAVLLYQEKPI